MIELIATNDSRAMRNKNNVLARYDLMINQKRSEEATAKFVSPSYIQHNPLIPDGSVALGRFFAKITSERPRARVVVHQIIAVGDYVWAHLNFLNLFNDDPNDTGIAGVDIYNHHFGAYVLHLAQHRVRRAGRESRVAKDIAAHSGALQTMLEYR